MISVEACPVCGAAPTGDRFELAGLPLTRCPSCSVVHALEHADPSAVYVDGYHSGAGGFHLDADREPFASYVRGVDARRVARVRREVPRGTWLDVGCGRGRLLQAVAQQGFSAVGVEPVDATAEGARAAGLDVRKGDLDALPDGPWDVVSAFHVLEHLPSVPSALASLRDAVRPGGLLAVEVPNWRSLCRKEMAERWSLLSPGEHITFFSRAVLATALSDAGFTDVRVESPSWVAPPQTLGQSLTDLGLRRRAGLLRPLHSGGVVRPVGWPLLRAADRVESRAGVGLTLLALARRQR